MRKKNWIKFECCPLGLKTKTRFSLRSMEEIILKGEGYERDHMQKKTRQSLNDFLPWGIEMCLYIPKHSKKRFCILTENLLCSWHIFDLLKMCDFFTPLRLFAYIMFERMIRPNFHWNSGTCAWTIWHIWNKECSYKVYVTSNTKRSYKHLNFEHTMNNVPYIIPCFPIVSFVHLLLTCSVNSTVLC